MTKMRPLTEEEKAPDREALRTYPYACKCGAMYFTIEWAFFVDLTGEPRFYCASCSARVVPTEPMIYNA